MACFGCRQHPVNHIMGANALAAALLALSGEWYKHRQSLAVVPRVVPNTDLWTSRMAPSAEPKQQNAPCLCIYRCGLRSVPGACACACACASCVHQCALRPLLTLTLACCRAAVLPVCSHAARAC